MNKITISEEKIINIANNVVDLEIKVPKLIINVNGKVIINENIIHNNQITINLAPNSNLIYNRFSFNSENLDVKINGATHSQIEYNHSLLTKKNTNLKITYSQSSNQGICYINIKGLTKQKGEFTIEADGIIEKNTKDNEYAENIKICTLNDTQNVIIPNLIIATDNVNALHNATISAPNKEEIFYLQTKGISQEISRKLIAKSFLIDNFTNELFINEISEIISKEV